MSQKTYEATTEDVLRVLKAHNAEMGADDIKDFISGEDERLSQVTLVYDEPDQKTATLDEIENILIEDEVIPRNAKKKFLAP